MRNRKKYIEDEILSEEMEDETEEEEMDESEDEMDESEDEDTSSSPGKKAAGFVDFDVNGMGSMDANGGRVFIQTDPRLDPNMAKLAPYNQMTIAPPKVSPVQMKEAFDAIFADASLSEEVVNKLQTVFVAALNEKVEEHAKNTTKILAEQYEKNLEIMAGTLAEKLDEYLGYVVEEWMTENKVEVERGIKTQVAENFIRGLKNLFEAHYIDVPEEKYNLVDELFEQNDELTRTMNKVINENMNLKKESVANKISSIFLEECHGLTDTQVEKLGSLAKGLDFDGEDSFRGKLQSLKEAYFFRKQEARPASVAPVASPVMDLHEMVQPSAPTIDNETVAQVARAMSRHIKK